MRRLFKTLVEIPITVEYEKHPAEGNGRSAPHTPEHVHMNGITIEPDIEAWVMNQYKDALEEEALEDSYFERDKLEAAREDYQRHRFKPETA